MAAVDYERAWLGLKKLIVAKPAHGQRDLLTDMARLEVECELEGEEGLDPTPLAPGRRRTRRSGSHRPALDGPREVRRDG